MKLLLLAFALLLAPALPAHAMDESAASIQVKSAYSYATAPVQKNGAVFMQLHNHQESVDKLIKATSDVAERVELHTHLIKDGMMMMREVEHYELAPSADVTLEPTGHHIMLLGLKAPLTKDKTFALTLTFEHAPEMTIDVQITAPGEKL